MNRAYGDMKGLKLLEGRFVSDQDLTKKRLVCVLGYEVAKVWGNPGMSAIVCASKNIQYEIIGVLNSTHWKASKNNLLTIRNLDKTVFIPLGTDRILPRRQLNFKSETLSEIILK